MNIRLTKSSLLAAQEIVKDQEIKKYKDLNFLESYKTALDIPNGKKIIETLGRETIVDLVKATKDTNYQLALRKILTNYIKKIKPGFMYRIMDGRKRFLNFVSENFEQLLKEAGLLEKIDLSEEGQKVSNWWGEIEEFVRKLYKNRKLELGREGEKKTMIYEENKLKKLNIDKKPSWDCKDDNFLGYDIQSWDEGINKIFIEVKTSSHPSGIFYLTRNEWNFSLLEKDSFLIHLWIQDQKKPRIISFRELNGNNYKVEDASNAEWSDIKITPIKIN